MLVIYLSVTFNDEIEGFEKINEDIDQVFPRNTLSIITGWVQSIQDFPIFPEDGYTRKSRDQIEPHLQIG